MPTVASKALGFLLLLKIQYLLLLCNPSKAEDPFYQFCENTASYKGNTTFQSNLESLFSLLTANAGTSPFFFREKGEDPDTVHGLYLCRGDVTGEVCKKCIDVASQEITRRCPNRTSIIWYDSCMLRYSEKRIYSVYDPTDNSLKGFNTSNGQNVQDPNGFNLVLAGLMDKLVRDATEIPWRPMFATGEVKFTSFQMIYGLVQCGQNLARGDCNDCLQHAISMLPSCCNGKQGGRVLGASCNLRYDVQRFYTTADGTPPLPRPPPSTTTTTGNGSNRTKVAIFSSVGTVLGVVLLGLCIYYRLRRKRQRKEKERVRQAPYPPGGLGFLDVNTYEENQVQTQELPLIDLAALQAATNDFSNGNELGEGGFGHVYKGRLPDGKEIAVKRLSKNSGQGLAEFKNEVTLIAKLQHRNLVRLLYCCIESGEKLLVYEYMPNTSLDVFLFDPIKRSLLGWQRRHDIVVGIARGLLYLHEDSRLRIIHRDLKASNVLLDNEMNPKISDFGMARFLRGNQSQVNTNRIVGTYGYISPEYAMGGLFSVKSDVYSFGVLLLEIISGKRNSGLHLPEYSQSLLAYAWKLWCSESALELIDPVIAESCPKSDVIRWIHIGLLCVQEDAADRPTISSVVLMLGSETMTLPKPTQPGFFVSRAVVESDKSSASAKICSKNELTVSILEAR